MKCLMIMVSVLLGLNALKVHAQDVSVTDKFKALESTVEGRVGLFAINTANEHVIGYRSEEIFPTGCTSIVIGVSAVLRKSMSDPTLLLRKILYSEEDLEKWSPVTSNYVNSGMTVQDLCAASINFSDHTAMNHLLKIIGGVQGMNEFARSIGNLSFRQDHDWPAEGFSGGKNNLKDSSSPKAMVESLRKLTIGDALDIHQKDLLISWLINTRSGVNRIRSAIPDDWVVGDKTGTGFTYGTTNDLAIVWPPHHAPILIGIYYTTDDEHTKKREDVIAKATRILLEEFVSDDITLGNPTLPFSY